jgi:ribA/ribD-fused uncharacterized protein
LSNFCDSPLEFEGIRYRNAEAAFQGAKTLDLEARRHLFSNATARDAKRAGRRQVRLRPDWEEAKTDVMRAVVTAKFTQNPGLKARLLATGDAELIEGNRWGDTTWGVCGGRGENRLGKILMEVRKALRRESQRNGV